MTTPAVNVMMKKKVRDDTAERSLPQLQSRMPKRAGALLFYVRRDSE